MQIDKLN